MNPCIRYVLLKGFTYTYMLVFCIQRLFFYIPLLSHQFYLGMGGLLLKYFSTLCKDLSE